MQHTTERRREKPLVTNRIRTNSDSIVAGILGVLLRGFNMRESDPTLRDTILALARRYDFEEVHSLQDERLALRLFDETAA